jgi:nucleoside-diphosphate-sugar epimerase
MTDEKPQPRLILLTGAAGRIGVGFYRHAAGRYRFRLADRTADGLTAAAEGDDVLALDVADLDACRAACDGIDTVVHLAADPSPEADFYGSLLDNNVKGTYNVFRAAADRGCRRVVYASSVHVVAGYPADVQVRAADPVNPANMYGVTKCFGEAVAACFAHAGLSAIAVRIGAYHAPGRGPADALAYPDAYVSERDLNQLLVRCVETPEIRFAVVYGLSDNRHKRADLSTARDLLGYAPEDDGFALSAERPFFRTD